MTIRAWVGLCIAAFLLGNGLTLTVVNTIEQKRFENLCNSLKGVPGKGASGEPTCIFSKNMV